MARTRNRDLAIFRTLKKNAATHPFSYYHFSDNRLDWNITDGAESIEYEVCDGFIYQFSTIDAMDSILSSNGL